MSAGEQSVFPIFYEFVRQQIAHSVVLIDEIDLNLCCKMSAPGYISGCRDGEN
ncbi:ATP-binding protein [Plectonema radiosum]|uniref:ATP-binding protein n=1 Tax=Plectonema radiosum TaxID=945768 RepID=UPI0021E7B6DA|nr:ATP-binding protein [Plectonema radiosum]